MPEVALVKPPLVNTKVMFVATLCARFVNATMPPEAAMLTVPCKVPAPAPRATLTTVPLSPLRKLPKASSIRITGCWANGTPAVLSAEG